MKQPNRRRFVSSIALGGIAGIAGCTDDSDPSPIRENGSNEARNLDDYEGEEGVITGIWTEPTTSRGESSRWDGFEVSFETNNRPFGDKIELTMQLFPLEMASPEYDSDGENSDDVKTLDTFEIVKGDWDHPDSFYVDLMDYWSEIPFKNHKAFGVELLLESESSEQPDIVQPVTTQIYDDTVNGFIGYTHREHGEVEEVICRASLSGRHTWVEDDEQHFVLQFGLSSRSIYYDNVPSIPVILKYSIDLEDMGALERIFENDPLAWQDYLDARSEGSLSGVEYLKRPVFAEIADAIDEAYDRHNLTEDDDLYVWSAFGFMSMITYAQPWDTVQESIRVPYPEQLIIDGEGDCKAQGFAVNGILHHLGYDTSLFLFRYTDAPPRGYHHLSGGVGMDLAPETSEIGERVERIDGEYRDSEGRQREGRWRTWRHPDFTETDERSTEHIKVDSSTGSIAGYSTEQTATTYYFVEGK